MAEADGVGELDEPSAGIALMADARPAPSRLDWEVLQREFRNVVEENLRSWVPADSPHYAQTLTFALGRLDEGRWLAGATNEWFSKMGDLDVLDIGAGNGGVSLGMANVQRLRITSIDLVPNGDLLRLRRSTSIPVQQIVGSGHHIPLKAECMDFVLCLETIEHVPSPAVLAQEILRVLRPGGLCIVTTPPRMRYLFAPDPHYGIRSLLLLPDRLQKYVAVNLLERTKTWDVEHVFWHSSGIARLFGSSARSMVLWNRGASGRTVVHDALWYLRRHFLWDRILIGKKGPGGWKIPRRL